MFTSLLSDLKSLLFLIILSFVFIVSDNLGYLDSPKFLIQKVTIPIQYGLYKTGISLSRQLQFVVLARRAAKENKALTEQLANIISENAKLRKKLAEYQAIKQQQSSLGDETFHLIPARPIGISRFLLIDKGSVDGVKLNQPVVYKDNLIGKIKTVSPGQAQVILPFDPDSKIAAFANNQNGKARGVLIGQFSVDMLLDKILHQEPISEGDLLYTEGTETEIPRGLVAGQVTRVFDIDNAVFKQAKVKPIFDVTNLDVVFVITN